MGTGEQEQAEFCELEYARLAGSLRLYTGDADLAAELAQEALARACLHWTRVRAMAAPGAWVHRVAVNLANSSFRRRGAERRALERTGGHVTADAADPSEAFTVRTAVLALPERQRLAIVLRYFADYPVDEVARIMHVRPGTVKSLTAQGIASLRAALMQEDRVP